MICLHILPTSKSAIYKYLLQSIHKYIWLAAKTWSWIPTTVQNMEMDIPVLQKIITFLFPKSISFWLWNSQKSSQQRDFKENLAKLRVYNGNCWIFNLFKYAMFCKIFCSTFWWKLPWFFIWCLKDINKCRTSTLHPRVKKDAPYDFQWLFSNDWQ